ncbi:MAG: hypothetical protein IPL01_12645 [Acidobacteria bacterium]|nr:hypothetical protein [Acidobacteriota bacterium]
MSTRKRVAQIMILWIVVSLITFPATGRGAGRELGVQSGLIVVSAASYSGDALAAEQLAAAFGNDLSTGTETAATLPLPVTLGGAGIRVKDSLGVERAAPLIFVSPNQVNFQVPARTATEVR